MKYSNRCWLTTFLVAGSLSACSSSSITSNDDENTNVNFEFSKAAIIFAEDDSPADIRSSPYFSVDTIEMSVPRTLEYVKSNVEAYYSPVMDECVPVSQLPLAGADPFGIGAAQNIDASEVLTLENNGNTFAEIPATRPGVYEWVGDSPGDNFPDLLKLGIPGSVFPAIPDISVTDLDDIAVTSEHQAGSGNGTIEWEPIARVSLPIWIVINANQLVRITADDGSFTLPDRIAEDSEISMIRRTISTDNRDDVMIATLRIKTWR